MTKPPSIHSSLPLSGLLWACAILLVGACSSATEGGSNPTVPPDSGVTSDVSSSTDVGPTDCPSNQCSIGGKCYENGAPNGGLGVIDGVGNDWETPMTGPNGEREGAPHPFPRPWRDQVDGRMRYR